MKRLLYSGALGVNNKIVPHRLPYDPKTGVAALEEAIDVLIGRTGEIVTRRGTQKVQTGSFHSFFGLGDGSFYVVEERTEDSALFKAVPNADGTLELYGIISGLSLNSRMDFVMVANRVLYCNGHQNGVLENDVSRAWDSQDWTGPDSTIEMVKPPVGDHIDFLSGRALLSKDDELFYSEHGLIGLVDEAGSRVRMEGKIIMICAVQTGVYISDTKAVYYLSGVNPKEWICKKVLNYPVIEWGKEHNLVDPSLFGLESFGLSCLFATVNGPVIGLPDGTAINLIDKVLTMPDCKKQSGSIMVVDETTILQG